MREKWQHTHRTNEKKAAKKLRKTETEREQRKKNAETKRRIEWRIKSKMGSAK